MDGVHSTVAYSKRSDERDKARARKEFNVYSSKHVRTKMEQQGHKHQSATTNKPSKQQKKKK